MEKVAEPSWTSSYTYQVSKHSAEMLHNLNIQRKDGGRFCDVILRVGEESFPAHKAVLAACSEYFESVFSRQAEDDCDSKELEMHTISPKVFKDVLDFAYTSRIVVRLECFPELMTAAKFLLMRSVIEICQEVIKQSNVQILVPTARGADASLFQANDVAEQGFLLAQHDLVNGTGMLVNGQSFANSAQMHLDGSENTAAVLSEDSGEPSMPMLEPVDGLSVSPPSEILGNAFPHDAGSPGSKRSRGRPKKPGGLMEAIHFNHNTQKDNVLFPCGTCGKAFTEASRLKNHEAQHGAHIGGVNNVSDSLSAASSMSLMSQSGLVENGLQLHGGLTLDTGRKRERTRRHVGCDICGKVFRDVYHLNRHKLSHSGEKPYACHVCGLRFKRKDRMSYHVRSHDGSVGKPYVCQSCGKGFSRPDHLNGHIKQVHTTERPHKCQICNASFATRDRLRSHLACHEDKIPCKVCGKFLRAAYMTDHLKKHSEGTHNYCAICNKGSLFTLGAGPNNSSVVKAPKSSTSSSAAMGSASITTSTIATTTTNIPPVKSFLFTLGPQPGNATATEARLSIVTSSTAALNSSAPSSAVPATTAATTTNILAVKKFVAAAVRSHFADCPDSHRHFCFHGTCRFLILDETPACVCHPGFVGMRCEHADLLAVVATNHRQQTVATVLILCVIGSVLIMVMCTLLHCWWRQGRRRRAHHYITQKHGVSCYPPESVV